MTKNTYNHQSQVRRTIIDGAWSKLLDANLRLGKLFNRKQPTKEEVSFLLRVIRNIAEHALEELEKEP